jgi:transposase
MPVRILITAGTVNDCVMAQSLTHDSGAQGLIADRGYDTNALINHAESCHMRIVIPPRQSRLAQRGYDREVYRRRYLVEHTFCILKEWRGIATRYAKNTISFLTAVTIRCLFGWLALS